MSLTVVSKHSRWLCRRTPRGSSGCGLFRDHRTVYRVIGLIGPALKYNSAGACRLHVDESQRFIRPFASSTSGTMAVVRHVHRVLLAKRLVLFDRLGA